MANERYGEYIEETPKLFLQGLFEESSTQKHPLGTHRKLSDGREFVYTKMGATAGVAGQVYQTPAVDLANVANVTVANANVGDRTITITPVTIVAGDLVANTFAEGFVFVNTGAANGMAYKIKSHPLLAANTAANFVLYDKLRSANLVTSTSKVTLVRHPCKDVIAHASPPTSGLVGVCTSPVTANYYVWLQTRGPCAVEVDGTVVNGDKVIPSANANGTVSPSANGLETEVTVGICLSNNANDHWALVDMKL